MKRRAQKSTQEIHTIIAELSSRSEKAVAIAQQGEVESQQGLQEVENSTVMLSGLSDTIANITDMTNQMAAAVEEQSLVAEDINQQMVGIADLANDSMNSSQHAQHSMSELNQVADSLCELVVRFSRAHY